MNNPAPSTHPSGEIEFWFEFASNYTYLSMMRIEDEAQRLGVHIQWRPFLLGPIFNALGMETSPFLLQREKGAYMWGDMVRQCEKYGLEWVKPSEFPRSGLLPARIAIDNAEKPWIGEFGRKVMERNFVLDQNINTPEDIAPVLLALNLPVLEIIEAAESDSAKNRLREQTQLAQGRRIFGAPTFFVGEEMFWGNDRLDDALACAATVKRP